MLSKRLNFYQPLSASCQSRAVFQQNQNNKQKHTQCTMGEISPDFHNWQLIYCLFTNKNYLNYLTYHVLVSCNHLNLSFVVLFFPNTTFMENIFSLCYTVQEERFFRFFTFFRPNFFTKSNEFSPYCALQNSI